VTEDSISVEWTRDGNSYFVLVRLTALAAEILCHLVEADDPVVHELDIAAVLYGSKCVGMDYTTMYPKIKTEPMRTLLAQAMISVEEMLLQSSSQRDGALAPDNIRTDDTLEGTDEGCPKRGRGKAETSGGARTNKRLRSEPEDNVEATRVYSGSLGEGAASLVPCADVAGLLKSIEEGNCVAFVGAGFSTAAELPDWGKLLWTLVHGLHAERVITEQEKAFLES
jgi:hypothetical protein